MAFLADVPGPHERQSLEYGFVQLRVGNVADPLGPGRHGSIYAADHWLRRPCWEGRWCLTLSDVQPRHSRAKVPKLRQRSALSVSPVASQPADTGSDRNQDHPLRSPVPSVRRKADRYPSTGVFGSHIVRDEGRSRKQTARFRYLLQQPSHAYRTARANAGYDCDPTGRQSPLISMATSLSIVISDTYGCVIFPRHALPAVMVDLGNASKKIIRCFSIAARFADLIVQSHRIRRDCRYNRLP